MKAVDAMNGAFLKLQAGLGSPWFVRIEQGTVPLGVAALHITHNRNLFLGADCAELACRVP